MRFRRSKRSCTPSDACIHIFCSGGWESRWTIGSAARVPPRALSPGCPTPAPPPFLTDSGGTPPDPGPELTREGATQALALRCGRFGAHRNFIEAGEFPPGPRPDEGARLEVPLDELIK